jgi:hypothetical protein
MALTTTQTPEILSKRMDEIQHLFAELAQVQGAIGSLEGEAREKVAREWRELSDTLTSKLKAAKYFKYDSSLFIKFLNAQCVEVVMVACFVTFEVFDAVWMDTICQAEIIDQSTYLRAVSTVVQEGGES